MTSGELLKKSHKLQPELVKIRRYLHETPELSFFENETSKYGADKLEKLGYQTKTGLARTGLIADLGKGSGPKIAIRADMDALPVTEENEQPYRSRNVGVMHACGHDAHISCALGAAQLLLGEQDGILKKMGGSIRMLMQPAEEAPDEDGYSGAYRMIEDEALKGVSAIIGLHMDASLAAGKVGIAAGPVMAAANHFKVIINGKGGHGAFPEDAIDAVVIGAQVVQAIQLIISRRISALTPAIITIGSFHSSSTRGNVISESVELHGTFRSFSETTHAQIKQELARACSIAEAMGGSHVIHYEEGYPVTVNDPNITAVMRSAAVDLIGEENVIHFSPKPWSEDFSMYQQILPGCFMFLGAEIEGSRRSHHTAAFDINESGLHIGAAIMAETAKRLVEQLADK
ncbi:unnamed protein product [Sphagnum balticum]